jgi:hypothetical protein
MTQPSALQFASRPDVRIMDACDKRGVGLWTSAVLAGCPLHRHPLRVCLNIHLAEKSNDNGDTKEHKKKDDDTKDKVVARYYRWALDRRDGAIGSAPSPVTDFISGVGCGSCKPPSMESKMAITMGDPEACGDDRITDDMLRKWLFQYGCIIDAQLTALARLLPS